MELPDAIRCYFHAHDRHDTDRALSAFASDATVTDEDREHRGTEQIREWLDTAASEFTYTRTLTGVERLDAETWLVRNRLDGDFPGGVADLGYRVTVRGDRITELLIAPRP